MISELSKYTVVFTDNTIRDGFISQQHSGMVQLFSRGELLIIPLTSIKFIKDDGMFDQPDDFDDPDGDDDDDPDPVISAKLKRPTARIIPIEDDKAA